MAAAVRGSRLAAFHQSGMAADAGLMHCRLRTRYPAPLCLMTILAASIQFFSTDRVVAIDASGGAMRRVG